MVSKPSNNHSTRPRRPPATTPEARESYMVDLAMSLAEEQMLNGTASAQVISHYLKMGSSRELLERQKMQHENELLRVKAEQMDQLDENRMIAENAIKAMRQYQGGDPEEDGETYHE